MKSTLIISLLFLSVTVLLGQSSMNIYASKSGKIKYQYEYAGVNTEYTIIFDDFGKKQVFDFSGNTGGLNEHARTIITPEAMYIVNYDDKQIIKFPVEADNASIDEYGSNMGGGIDIQAMIAEVKESSGGKKGSEVVAGKNCDIYEYAEPDGAYKGKYWIWNGYLLRAEFLDASGEHTFMKVKELNLDSPVDKKEFEVPAGFEITDMTQMMEQMKQLQQMYGVPDDGNE